MSDEYTYVDPFADEEQEVIEKKPISQDEGFEKIKKELDRVRQEKADVERQAQLNAQRASQLESTMHQKDLTNLADEKARAENELKVHQLVLKNAKETGDYGIEAESTSAMIKTQSRIDQIDNALKSSQKSPEVPQQTVAQAASYDGLMNSSIGQEHKDFLAARPELKDPRNLNILMEVAGKVNASNDFVFGSPGWFKEVDRRLEVNGVYGDRQNDRIEKRDREDNDMSKDRFSDQDDYRERQGNPRDNGPISIPRGDGGGSSTGSTRGRITLTKEEREIANTVGDWGDGKYARGKAMIEFLKRSGQYKDPKNNEGKLEICLGGLREFAKMQRR